MFWSVVCGLWSVVCVWSLLLTADRVEMQQATRVLVEDVQQMTTLYGDDRVEEPLEAPHEGLITLHQAGEEGRDESPRPPTPPHTHTQLRHAWQGRRQDGVIFIFNSPVFYVTDIFENILLK